MTAEVEHRPLSQWELAPLDELERMQQGLLEEQLRYVLESSRFYRRKLASVGLDRVRAELLTELPFTTKDELRTAQAEGPPFGSLQAADGSDIVRLHVTSGTTGRPLSIGFTRRDLALSSRVGARAYWAAGVEREDVMLHCLNYSFYVGGLADHLALERTGATVIPVGLGQSERILELWQDLRPTGLYSTPSYSRHLAGVATKLGIDPRSLGLRIVLGGGEPGGDIPETRALIEETWGALVGDIYGLGEVWPTFAGHCGAQDGLHLTAPDALIVELVDPRTEHPLGLVPGTEGELVYTHLRRQATPLVRYRSGDVARVLEPCSCGRTTPRIRIVRRTDAMFIVRGVNVFPQAIEAVLDEHVTSHGAFAVLLAEPQPQPPIQLVVEAEGGNDEVATRVEAAIRSRLQVSCRVSFVSPASLAIPSEHKSKRVFRTYAGERPPGLTNQVRAVPDA